MIIDPHFCECLNFIDKTCAEQSWFSLLPVDRVVETQQTIILMLVCQNTATFSIFSFSNAILKIPSTVVTEYSFIYIMSFITSITNFAFGLNFDSIAFTENPSVVGSDVTLLCTLFFALIVNTF